MSCIAVRMSISSLKMTFFTRQAFNHHLVFWNSYLLVNEPCMIPLSIVPHLISVLICATRRILKFPDFRAQRQRFFMRLSCLFSLLVIGVIIIIFNLRSCHPWQPSSHTWLFFKVLYGLLQCWLQ